MNRTSNKQESGLGGALHFNCEGYSCLARFEGLNIFESNFAENAGGAIKWDDIEP